MATIAYNKPVKDLIAGLNATGHVTHTTHRKDMVTIHHNGGRLSHEGVLDVWKTRPASAHFDVDGFGAIAQYVKLNEYAWACGNTEGNQRSVSIEMCNSDVGGNWPVAEVTWTEAARLAGWIFAKAYGFRPTNDNLVVHHHWKSTSCAGPYIDTVRSRILQVANQSYDYFTSGSPKESVEEKKEVDMSVLLVRGDSSDKVPGKTYSWGDLQFLVHFDPELPGGWVRRYIPAGPLQRVLQKAQGGVEVVKQDDLDKCPFVNGGDPPDDVIGLK